MSQCSVKGITLRGIVCALPQNRVENDYFAGRFDEKTIQDVTKLTGVSTRYIAPPKQTASDLCFAAAERLLEDLNWPRESVDAIIFVTQTPDQRMPATACILHGRLGLAPHCQAFDVGLGCSGYVYGAWLVSALMAIGLRRVLLLAGDTSSRMVDPDDRSTALLFGDAGSATAFEYDTNAPPCYFDLGTDGKGAHFLTIPGGGFRPTEEQAPRADSMHMDGSAMFGFTISAVPKLIKATLEQAHITQDDVDMFALHQANRFILRHIGKKLNLAPDQLPINIDRFGNTSSASIPLLLCTDKAEDITTKPTTILMAGFGVGLSWGAVLFKDFQLQCASVITV
ncbi:MAG: ketoacyl-ACP synthase III [Acetobacter sp.]